MGKITEEAKEEIKEFIDESKAILFLAVNNKAETGELFSSCLLGKSEDLVIALCGACLRNPELYKFIKNTIELYEKTKDQLKVIDINDDKIE